MPPASTEFDDSQNELAPNGEWADAAPEQPLGKAAGRGFSWLSLCLVAGKLFSFLAQIVLGRILLDEDFGVFAIATSIANFLKVFNDGGVAQVLIQRGAAQFEKLSSPAFWIGMLISTLTGLLLVLIGLLLALLPPGVAGTYGDPRLLPLLLVFALTVFLSAPATVFKAKLRIDLRFTTLAWQGTAWFAIRYFGVILFAFWGFGAMSFVLPLPIVSIFECIVTFLATRVTPWTSGLQLQLWPSILGKSLWVMVASFARGFARNGDYLVLGLLALPSLVGQYFFGYQLTAQFAILMAANVQFVLFPVMTRLVAYPSRQQNAVLKTIRLMMLIAGPICLLVALNIEALEKLLWDGKWAVAVPLMQIFSIAAPIRLIPDIVHALIGSHGEFRRSARLFVWEGIVLMSSVWLAVSFVGDRLTLIALIVALAQVAFSLVMTYLVLAGYGIGALQITRAIFPAWFSSMLAAIVPFQLGHLLVRPNHLVLLVACDSILFSVLFIFVMRTLFSRHLEDLAAVIPHPWDAILRKFLFLSPFAVQG